MAKMFAFEQRLSGNTLPSASMRKKASKQKNEELLLDNDLLPKSREKTHAKS